MSGTSIFIGITSCFRLGPLKSGMLCEVESNAKMTKCRLQSGDGEVGMARWRLKSRERLPSWEMLGAGRGCLGGGGWRGGQNCWGGGSFNWSDLTIVLLSSIGGHYICNNC